MPTLIDAEQSVQNFVVRVDEALVAQICLDFTVYTSGSFFEEKTRPGVIDFYRQVQTLFGPQWTFYETEATGGPKRADARALELFPSWFSEAARRREQYVLVLRDGQKIDDIGTMAFECGTYSRGNFLGFLRLSLPMKMVAAQSKPYAELCSSLVRSLPFHSARAGYSLRWNEYGVRHHRKGLQYAEIISQW